MFINVHAAFVNTMDGDGHCQAPKSTIKVVWKLVHSLNWNSLCIIFGIRYTDLKQHKGELISSFIFQLLPQATLVIAINTAWYKDDMSTSMTVTPILKVSCNAV